MPKRVPQPETFPAIYHNVAQIVGGEGRIFRVPGQGRLGAISDSRTGETVSEWTQICRLRAHWEAFKLSLKRGSIENPERWGEAYRLASSAGFYPNKEGGFVEFRPRDQSWHALMLAKGAAVGDAAPARPDFSGDVVESAQEKFLQSLNEDLLKGE